MAGETGESRSGGGFMESWRKRFTDFLRTSPRPGEKKGPAPAAPLQRTDTPAPLQDIRDKRA